MRDQEVEWWLLPGMVPGEPSSEFEMGNPVLQRSPMKSFYFFAIMAALFLGFGVFVSCGGNDDNDIGDDDENNSSNDDLVDNGDKTATDTDTGLMWQINAPGSDMDLDEAVNYCNKLSLATYDDWHLPSINELRTLIRGCPFTEPNGACDVTDSCTNPYSCYDSNCGGCYTSEGPANGCYWPNVMQGYCGWYYTSTGYGNHSYIVDFRDGALQGVVDIYSCYVRCVRSTSD